MERDISWPGLLAVEEGELERLEVRVHAVAQVELHPERHAAGDQPAHHAEREPEQPGARDRERQRPERRAALRISSMVRPTRNGTSTPIPIAAAASTKDATTPRR